ncbi:MAG: DUF3781 domain-containing protein [Firmicutes bacterium]|nr:DUF3781 domain-containing protein [Bacillota bacterium]
MGNVNAQSEYCKNKILQSNDIESKGKNWYVNAGESIVTVNAHSYTIITAHKVKILGK